MALNDRVPSPSIAPPRWPGLLASVGGEAAVREFMRTNPTQGGGDHWEGGFTFQPNDCLADNDAVQNCVSLPFDLGDETSAGTPVTVVPLYYWDSAACSTIGNNPDEVTRRAADKLARGLSHKLEAELWTGARHTALGLSDQALPDLDTVLLGGVATPAVNALAELQNAWGACSKGGRGMIHATVRTVTIWQHAQVVRREGALILDEYDNIVVAGTGYTGTASEAIAYATPVVNVRLGDVVVVKGEPTRVDIPNNLDRAMAYRAGAVYFDPCCVYSVNVDHNTVIG